MTQYYLLKIQILVFFEKGSYFKCLYNVTTTDEETTLINSTSGITSMQIDGENVPAEKRTLTATSAPNGTVYKLKSIVNSSDT